MLFPGRSGKNTRFFYPAEYPSTGQHLRHGSRWFDPLLDPERQYKPAGSYTYLAPNIVHRKQFLNGMEFRQVCARVNIKNTLRSAAHSY
jgi:hypothetical protein